jgi:DNA modification methylase
VASSVTPKLSAADKAASLYPYYAGYSERFVGWALDEMRACKGQAILDPWNGTGTTTAVGALKGLKATGIDLNPVLSFVAKARLASGADRQHIIRWIDDWGSEASVDLLQAALETYQHARRSDEFIQGSPAEALMVVGMFPAIRSRFKAFKTKNPSWFSEREFHRANPDNLSSTTEEIKQSILKTVARQSQLTEFTKANVTIINSDIHLVTLPSESFDLILTSPPYLTRIDYVQATLPELLLLQTIGVATPRDYLRRRMIGSPITGEVSEEEVGALPSSIQAALDQIRTHHSKASGGYYWRFFAKYFVDMRASISAITTALKPGGQACFVTQPSYYKEVLIDLPALLADLVVGHDCELLRVAQFDSKLSMSSVNVRANEAARRPAAESASFFKKVSPA